MAIAPSTPADGTRLRRLGSRMCVVSAGSDLTGVPASAFEDTVYEALQLGCREFVLDLTRVMAFDASVAAVAHELEVALAGHGCDVVLAVTEPLAATLHAARVGLWWDVAVDVPEALTLLLRQPVPG